MAKSQTTMLPLYRLEPDGSESCFLIEVGGRLNSRQAEKVMRAIAPILKYLPTHTVTMSPTLSGERVGLVGPRLPIETPDSSRGVEILQAIGFKNARRVERFRRHIIPVGVDDSTALSPHYDHITETTYDRLPETFFAPADIPPIRIIRLLEEGPDAVRRFSEDENLNFNEPQLTRIIEIFTAMGTNPTDIALYQLSQMWSDHCRHWRFNARLIIDGVELPYTLFDLVKAPYKAIQGSDHDNILIAFHDNASAIEGFTVPLLVPSMPGIPCPYVLQDVSLHLIISAETHNYPGHVYPYAGAATEIGGEIRDQVGCGLVSDLLFAGCGRILGSLRFPNGYRIPGEFLPGKEYTYPTDKATPIEVLVGGLKGWHDYANCFGKPCTYGFTFTGAVWRPRRDQNGEIAYEHLESQKPVCFGVSCGTIREEHLYKQELKPGYKIVSLGGPALPIGRCGASGSSAKSGENVAAFDEQAVQRGNPEMQRRFYQTLLALQAMEVLIPVKSNHDQGGGGLANNLTELIGTYGGKLYIGSVRRADPTMPDLDIWVCEYQERQGIVVTAEGLPIVEAICIRENCPMEVLGEITGDGKLIVYSERDEKEVKNKKAKPIIELELKQVLEELPAMVMEDEKPEIIRLPLVFPENQNVEKATPLVFRRTEVGHKLEYIKTVDGSIGGQTILNQYDGPYHTAINDCTLHALSHDSIQGEASSIGVQPFIMALDPEAGARIAIGEMITNLMGVYIGLFERIQCICNCMWPLNLKPADGEVARAVMAYYAGRITLEELLIAVIGGKDSSSMVTVVKGEIVKSLPTLVYSSIAPVANVNRYVTPRIKHPGSSILIHADIANGKRRLGGSSLALAHGQLGDWSPDLDDATLLKNTFAAVQEMLSRQMILAGHDISSGGILTTISEMCFGSGCGVKIELNSQSDALHECFAEELGYVVECDNSRAEAVCDLFGEYGVPHRIIGKTQEVPRIQIGHNDQCVLDVNTWKLRRQWERTGYEVNKLRINPEVARREWRNTRIRRKPQYRLTFTPKATPPAIIKSTKQDEVMVVREQGTTCHPEMIAAWKRGGFKVIDVHMNDFERGLIKTLDYIRGLIWPGGFSYGDTFGAAVGQAAKIMFNPIFQKLIGPFMTREDTFSLGICNGCQLIVRCGWAPLPNLPPNQQPRFTLNESGSFIHRWVTLKILESPSIFFQGMEGSILGAYVANAEGRFNCDHDPALLDRIMQEKLVPLVYVDPQGRRTTAPPYSPSGEFIAGVCDPTGRHTAMMPHTLDRGDLLRLWEYFPPEWKEKLPKFENGLIVAPWHQMVINAREWCNKN